MKFKVILILLLFGLILKSTSYSQENEFIKVDGGHFYKGDKQYKFLGTNYWYGMYLGMESHPGDRTRLLNELDQLQSLGINNLRILGSSEGSGKYQITPTLLNTRNEYNEDVFKGIDFFLNELRKRNMTAVMVLNNFWMWSGGMPQYVSWASGSEVPLPDIENEGSWDDFINYSLSFYGNKKAQRYYRIHLKKIVNRINSISGIKYKDDPTIMSWQLANEPRGYSKQNEYRKWIKKTADFLNRIDTNHLISLGAEGNGSSPKDGIDLFEDNKFESIDYATIHLWIQNWGWYDPKQPETFDEALVKTEKYLNSQLRKADSLKKPVVLEEFGVSRDEAMFSPFAATKYRDIFYEHIFKITFENIKEGGSIQGCNFWSWGGDGTPAKPGEMWDEGSSLIGDPPHEKQGWYSVYSHDVKTLKIIKEFSSKINEYIK